MIAEIEKQIDKILITGQEYKRIMRWGKDNLNASTFQKRMFFPLKTFILDFTYDKNTRAKCLVELDSFCPYSGARVTGEDYFFIWKREPENHRFKVEGKGRSQHEFEVIHFFIMGVLIYICTADRNKEYRERIERARTSGRTNPYEYHDRVCFLLNDIIEYAGTHKTRKSIQYQCECWGVRGHLRHYTDGRVVFIEPYKKGRKRDILEPRSKTYMMGV